MTYTTDTDRTTTGSPWGGAAIAGVVSLIVNLIVLYILYLIIPPIGEINLGWTMTMVAILSFFAGLFSYYGGWRQSTATAVR